MKTLVICRICLTKDVQHVVKDLRLQETYERMTTIPFQRPLRPLALCYICFAQLKASHRFKLKCLKAEELLAQMLDRLPADEDGVPDPALIDRSALNHLNFCTVEQTIIDSTVPDVDCKVEIEFEYHVKLEENTPADPIEKKAEVNESIPVKSVQTEIGNIKAEPSELNPNYDIKYPIETSINHIEINSKGEFRKRRIKAHTRTHAGEKSFACNVCKKSFRKKCGLIDHARTHTGERPYVCNVCKKGFNQKSHLTNHTRTHTGEKPYVCDMCKNSFTLRSSLIQHIRTHIGEKPYICNVCKKSFCRRSGLFIHTRTHTGLKPYVCDICKQSFTHRSHLIKHVQTVCLQCV